MRLRTFKQRSSLLDSYKGALGEQGDSVKVSCEVGVWRGHFSREIVSRFRNSLEKHYLIDPWAPQENEFYVDDCNKSMEVQEEALASTKEKLSALDFDQNKLHFLRGLSSDMCHQIPDDSLDFCYIDARHDYLGCKDDINSFWPKVKSGRMLAGHDYLDAKEASDMLVELGHNLNQDWSLCYDGTTNGGAVKEAVNEFARENDLQVFVTYRDNWTSWAVLKS